MKTRQIYFIILVVVFAKTSTSVFCDTDLPIWPTDGEFFFGNAPIEKFIQPTSSGVVISGTFGFVRSNGARFHEGIDIKSAKRNRRNHPEDNIFAVLDGTVAYINKSSGRSSYGIYVILEHEIENFHYYTLYAHLSCVDKAIHAGQKIKQRTIIGKMGNTSCAKIPLNLAHLHFEIGIKIGTENSFANWYNAQKFKQKNFHGQWNGMNLIGVDPLDFFKSKKNFFNYIKSQKTAFALTIKSTKFLKFIERNSSLLKAPVDRAKKLVGWQVEFSALAVPLSFEPVYDNLTEGAKVLYANENIISPFLRRNIILFDRSKKPYIGKTLHKVIKLLSD